MSIHDPNGQAARLIALRGHVALIDRVLADRGRYSSNIAARHHMTTLTDAGLARLDRQHFVERMRMHGVQGGSASEPSRTLLSWRDAAMDHLADARP